MYKNFFIKKTYYYRPINLELLSETNILHKNTLTNTFIKVYNTFSYPIIYKENKVIKTCFNDDIFDIIEYNLLKYNSCSDIFNNVTYKDIKNIFHDDLFYKFLIYDKHTNKLTDFICLIPTLYGNKNDKQMCRNAHFYLGFFQSQDLQYKYNLLEYICYYANEHDLFDMMTILDEINSNCKLSSKFFKSIKKKYYYDIDINIHKLEHEIIILNNI